MPDAIHPEPSGPEHQMLLQILRPNLRRHSRDLIKYNRPQGQPQRGGGPGRGRVPGRGGGRGGRRHGRGSPAPNLQWQQFQPAEQQAEQTIQSRPRYQMPWMLW